MKLRQSAPGALKGRVSANSEMDLPPGPDPIRGHYPYHSFVKLACDWEPRSWGKPRALYSAWYSWQNHQNQWGGISSKACLTSAGSAFVSNVKLRSGAFIVQLISGTQQRTHD